MKPLPSYLWPSRAELVVLFLLSCILGTFRGLSRMLDAYGARASWQTVLGVVSGGVSHALIWLDTLQMTPAIVTFLIWVVVGVIVLCIFEAFVHVARQVAYEADYSSSHFLHPANFSRTGFWRHVVLQSISTLGIVALLFCLLYLSLVVVLPTASLYASSFAFIAGVYAPGYIALGLVIIFLDLVAFDVCVRLYLHRNRAIA